MHADSAAFESYDAEDINNNDTLDKQTKNKAKAKTKTLGTTKRVVQGEIPQLLLNKRKKVAALSISDDE